MFGFIMISLLLFYKIVQFFAVLVLGFIVVKANIAKSEDSTILSKLSLYFLMPAAIINAFDIGITKEIMQGLILAFAAAIIVHIVLLVIDWLHKKLCGAGCVERASAVYSNAANLIIPIVAYVLGDEWVIYSAAFLSVQLVFFWTHGVRIFEPGQKTNVRKILLNPTIIAIGIGIVMIAVGIRLPNGVKEVVSSLGGMIGNVGMLIAGMVAADFDYKRVFKDKRLYSTVFIRMIICPIIALLLLKGLLALADLANAEKIILISFLAAITPTAATILQYTQIRNEDVDLAVAINLVTTILCIVTMPVFVALYG